MIFSNNNIPHSFSFFVMHLYITDSKATQLKKNLPFPAFYLPSLVLLPHRKLFFGYSLQHIKLQVKTEIGDPWDTGEKGDTGLTGSTVLRHDLTFSNDI